MKIKELNYPEKKIFVVDNFFSCHEQAFFETFCGRSVYTPNTVSSEISSNLFNHYLHCRLSRTDENNFGLLSERVYNLLCRLFPEFKNLSYIHSWINLTLPNGVYQTHVDELCKESDTKKYKTITLLYYVTSNWNDTYNGQTFFYNYNDLSEAELAVSYKEGRMVVFDSTIPHKPAISCNHQKPRYVYNAKFKCENQSNVENGDSLSNNDN